MALSGLLGENSYSVVSVQNFDKQDKSFLFRVKTYTDSSKTRLLAVLDVGTTQYSPLFEVPELTSTIPQNPQQNDIYAVQSGAQGDWANKVGKVVIYESGTWSILTNQLVWCTADSKVYSSNGSAWAEDKYVIDSHIFDANFSVAQISGDNNILSAAYDYIKTRPEYSACEDV
jgi:hypothetical protein